MKAKAKVLPAITDNEHELNLNLNIKFETEEELAAFCNLMEIHNKTIYLALSKAIG